jgi:hypothetical protein
MQLATVEVPLHGIAAWAEVRDCSKEASLDVEICLAYTGSKSVESLGKLQNACRA